MIDVTIRAEDQAHAVRIAKGAGIMEDAATEIEHNGSALWLPTTAILEARGLTVTPEIEALLATGPWRVFYEPRQAPWTTEPVYDEDGNETTPGVRDGGTWYGLRIDAPAAVGTLLAAQLSAETWADGTTPILVPDLEPWGMAPFQ